MPTKNKNKAAPKHLLSVAAFCSQILDGVDGYFSGIRFVDHCFVPPPPSDKPGERTLVSIWAFIGFKSRTFASGELTGDHSLRLVIWSPGRKKKMVHDYPMPSVAENVTGFNVRIKLDLQVKTQGVWWVNVFLDDRLYAKMPLRIVFGNGPDKLNS
jgi:hypothetical protein